MSKILSIAWYNILPPKFGGQKGIALFTKHLARFHDIVMLCSKNNQPSHQPFEVRAELPVSKTQFLNPFSWRKITTIAQEVNPAFIVIEHPYHGIAGRRASRRTGAKLIVHSHNIESQRFKQLGKWWWRILSSYEKWTHRHADLNLFKTQADLDWAVNHFQLDKKKCIVIPYGIETKPAINKQQATTIIRNLHGLTTEKILLFAGTLDYKPNADAVEKIVKQIAPALEEMGPAKFKIIICGRGNLKDFRNKFKHPAVIYAGEVDDIENYFAAADIFLDPVTVGGGIQTKIIEALSYDLDVICFERMIDGMLASLAAGKLFLCKEGQVDEMIMKIVQRMAVNENNQPVAIEFLEYYNWANIVKRLNEKLIAIYE